MNFGLGDFGGTISLDALIVGVTRRFNLFWILPDQGHKLGPSGGLVDPIRNVRNVKKTQGGVVLKEAAVLMGLLLRRK